MADDKKGLSKLDNNKTIFMVVAAVAVIVIVGAYVYNQNQKKHTVSMDIGGKHISATFKQ